MGTTLERKRKLPNLLTLFRIGLFVPLLIFILLAVYADVKNGYLIFNSLILVTFVLAMATDFLDGYLARRWNVVSETGKLWDPLADKIITTTVLIYLAGANFVSFWIVVLIVVRDLLIDGHRVAMAQKNIEVSASIFGKIKTIVVSLGIVMVLMLNLIFVDLIQSNISSGNVAGAKQYLPYINPNLRSYLGQALNTLPVPNVNMLNNDVLGTSELHHNFLNVNTVDLADNTKYILVTNLALLLGMLTSLLSGAIYLADFYRKNKS